MVDKILLSFFVVLIAVSALTRAGLPVREAASVETVHDVFHLGFGDSL